jgi:hypothetical protein
MSSKRARIADSNPFTATDGVLAGYEQANKSSHQPVEPKSDARQVEKSASQPANNSTSQEVSKPTSQQANNSTSQEVDKSTSQQSDQSLEDDRILDNPTTEEVNNLTSQQVDVPKSTSQEANKSAIEEVSKSTSQEVDQPELDDRGVERESQLAQPASQQADKLASQEVDRLILRKATYQIDAAVLEALDRYHLQLQIDLGRRNAPHKETIVEEAIVQWLERTAKSPDRAVKSLIKRQEQR